VNLLKIKKIWIDSWFNPFFAVEKSGRELLEKERRFFRGIVLDIGCGDKPYLSCFNDRIDKYIGIDLPAGKRDCRQIDCWANGENLPFRGNSLDNVISSYALGDNREPGKIMAEIGRVLKPGGHLFLLEAQWWPLHDEPFDYWRFTKYSLGYLASLHSLKVVKIKPIGGGYLSLGLHLNYYLFYHLGLKSPFLLVLTLPLYFLIQIAAYIFDSIHQLEDDPTGYLMVAEKS
jgi:SAM-dependent methyltransferase